MMQDKNGFRNSHFPYLPSTESRRPTFPDPMLNTDRHLAIIIRVKRVQLEATKCYWASRKILRIGETASVDSTRRDEGFGLSNVRGRWCCQLPRESADCAVPLLPVNVVDLSPSTTNLKLISYSEHRDCVLQVVFIVRLCLCTPRMVHRR